jgi:hypothetical protein
MKDFIHAHKFSLLDNKENVFYTKGDIHNILNMFANIEKINKNVILITANSDVTIDENLIKHLPRNVYKWFAQNAMANHPKLEIIPEGLQPSFQSSNGDIGYEIAKVKEDILSSIEDTVPKKLVYSNFAIGTNPTVRSKIKDLCHTADHIDWDESIDFSDYHNYNNINSLHYFYNKIKEYESVVCPIGNGIDTHRVYETLYLNRIPIVFNEKIYNKLYVNYPIILIDENDLMDETKIKEKIIETKKNNFDENMLFFDFWKNKILSTQKEMLTT